MKAPWANIALLIIVITLVITGYLGLVNGQENAAWRLWLHGIAAYALIVLFLWKSTVILDAYRRKSKWTRLRLLFAFLLILLLATVLLGLLWTLDGPRYLGGFSLVSLHIYLAVPVLLIMLWHSWRMRFIFRVEGALDRRLFLGMVTTVATGLLFWRSAGKGQEALGWNGAERRFTGSYERGSFQGQFPSVSWMFDNPPPVDETSWRLAIAGAVREPTIVSYAALLALPAVTWEVLLDCTSGWYTTQTWTGVAVPALLAGVGVSDKAASITVESVTGYKRRFALEKADKMLLAYQVAGAPLSHGHGAPLRLVLPGRRGFEWVKWISALKINETSALWQPPLPLR